MQILQELPWKDLEHLEEYMQALCVQGGMSKIPFILVGLEATRLSGKCGGELTAGDHNLFFPQISGFGHITDIFSMSLTYFSYQ